MSASHDTIRDDLAFLRAMAEAGRDGPPTVGPWLLVPGIIYALASFLCWAILRGIVPLAPGAILWCWVGAMAVHMLSLPMLSRMAPKSETTVNRALSIVWKALGYAIFTCFLCWLLFAWLTGNGIVWAMFPSVVLALYGAAWSVNAAVARQGWLRWTAALSFAGAIAAIPLTAGSGLFLFYGVVTLLVVALPGWRLMVMARAAR